MIKVLVLALCAITIPLREVVDIRLTIPTQQHEIFYDYSNDNFSQVIRYNRQRQMVSAHVRSSNLFGLNLNFRIIPDYHFIRKLHPQLQEELRLLLADNKTMKNYFSAVSEFLRNELAYTERELPQDAESVIFNRKAHCVGYSNLLRVFLKAVGIDHKVVRGFYLKEQKVKGSKTKQLQPIPHRWVEIFLPNDVTFYYDPQYQEFSANYLTTKSDINFRRVRKFKVRLVKKSKQVLN